MKATVKVGYDEQFRNLIKRGWGCGYAVIPKGHPILTKLEDETCFYLQVGKQEITLSEWQEENYVIGFDTAHSWNNESHNKKWVENEAKKLVDEVNSFTKKDAFNYIQSKIDKLILEQNKL